MDINNDIFFSFLASITSEGYLKFSVLILLSLSHIKYQPNSIELETYWDYSFVGLLSPYSYF